MEMMRDYHLSMEIWNGGQPELTLRGKARDGAA
jgi:hypothetical protein